MLHLLVNCLSHLEPVGTASLLLSGAGPPLRHRYIRGHSSADRLYGILQERGRLGRLSAQSPCRSSALGQGRWERGVVQSSFRSARSMVQVFRVGREERRC